MRTWHVVVQSASAYKKSVVLESRIEVIIHKFEGQVVSQVEGTCRADAMEVCREQDTVFQDGDPFFPKESCSRVYSENV